MDLTLGQFRQKLAAIQRRMYLEERAEMSRFSWLARQLAQFTAGGYMVDPKKGNPALDAAAKLAFDEIEAAQLEEAEKLRADQPVENKPGSFERFMGSMGSPGSWAGR